jgi:hypothetical protein
MPLDMSYAVSSSQDYREVTVLTCKWFDAMGSCLCKDDVSGIEFHIRR